MATAIFDHYDDAQPRLAVMEQGRDASVRRAEMAEEAWLTLQNSTHATSASVPPLGSKWNL